MKITYLSDINRDFRCLEDWLSSGEFGDLEVNAELHESLDLGTVEDVFSYLSKILPDFDRNDVERYIGQFDELVLPTRYESPFLFKILESLVRQLKESSKNLQIDTSDFPHYSSIPTGAVNAQAINLPCSSKPFLLFDSEIFNYCQNFSFAFAQCLPCTSDGEKYLFSTDLFDVSKHLANNPAGIDLLADILFSYTSEGTLSKPDNQQVTKQAFEDPGCGHFSQIITAGMESFLVAHEFGHVYSGHLNDLLRRFAIPNDHIFEIEDKNSRHAQEYEADLMGLLLTLEMQRIFDFDASHSYIGADLFFSALDLSDRFKFYVRNRLDDSGYISASYPTHPSHHARQLMLRKHVLSAIKPIDQAQLVIQSAESYSSVIELVWKILKRDIEDAAVEHGLITKPT